MIGLSFLLGLVSLGLMYKPGLNYSIDFKGVLSALRASGYTGCVSVKVYRHLGWEQAAETAQAAAL